MSYSDFEKGIPTVPFCLRKPKQASETEDYDLITTFGESERRLKILRLLTGGDHEPTREEMIRWINAVKKK